MKTFYKSVYNPDFNILEQDIETDVAVIGGGLAGLLCAQSLTEAGKKVALFESNKVGEGQTARSTAMVSFVHDIVYYRLIKKHGIEKARQYLNLQKDGINIIEDIIKKYNLDCDYTKCDMNLFSTTFKGSMQLKKEFKAYNTLLENVSFALECELPFKVRRVLKIANQGYLNPLSFIKGLAQALSQRGVKIFENTHITQQPKDGSLKFGKYNIKADAFIVATHFPFINVPGFYFAKIFQSRSHNIAFTTDKTVENIYESAEDSGFEYRPIEGGIICGGANIRTGKYKHKSQYNIVEKNIEESFGILPKDIITRFSAQDCITFDMMPFAGLYSDFLENVYLVTGFNKWGFTNAAACAKTITNMIVKGETADNLFDPKRAYLLKSPLKSTKNIAALLTEFANLILPTETKKLKRIKNGQGAVINYKGKKIGVYRDDNGKLKAVSAVCPHVGCRLHFNKDERSWDCPCHGSRFDIDGKILDNPAIKKAEKVRIGK